MSTLKLLVASTSFLSHAFDLWPFYVKFVVKKVALGQVFLLIVRFSTVFNILPMFHSLLITIPLLLNTALISRKSGGGQ